MMVENIIDLSSKSCKKKNKILNETNGKCIDVNSIEPGDKIWADLGGIELASGKVFDPNEKDFEGKRQISFWSYSGWRHLEIARPDQIVKIKKK
jgi:hypothetical protein